MSDVDAPPSLVIDSSSQSKTSTLSKPPTIHALLPKTGEYRWVVDRNVPSISGQLVKLTAPDIEVREAWLKRWEEQPWLLVGTLTYSDTKKPSSFDQAERHLKALRENLEKRTGAPVHIGGVIEIKDGKIHSHPIFAGKGLTIDLIEKSWHWGSQTRVEDLGAEDQPARSYYRYILKDVTTNIDQLETARVVLDDRHWEDGLALAVSNSAVASSDDRLLLAQAVPPDSVSVASCQTVADYLPVLEKRADTHDRLRIAHVGDALRYVRRELATILDARITVYEAARLANKSHCTIRRAIRKGELQDLGRHYRPLVLRAEVMALYRR